MELENTRFHEFGKLCYPHSILGQKEHDTFANSGKTEEKEE